MGSSQNVYSFIFFKFIIHWFWVYTLVVRQSYALHSVPLNIFIASTGTIYSYHNIIDYIFYDIK